MSRLQVQTLAPIFRDPRLLAPCPFKEMFCAVADTRRWVHLSFDAQCRLLKFKVHVKFFLELGDVNHKNKSIPQSQYLVLTKHSLTYCLSEKFRVVLK